jgi:hypothetical protein
MPIVLQIEYSSNKNNKNNNNKEHSSDLRRKILNKPKEENR